MLEASSNRTNDIASIRHHYEMNWSNAADVLQHDRGPIIELPPDFCVLRFPPTGRRTLFTYATCGMSIPGDSERLEVFILSPTVDDSLVELMTMLAHYHRTLRAFGLGHLLQFGRPWLPDSQCDSGLISLPYLDGPKVEWLKSETTSVRFLWLIPITCDERVYCRENGVEALESLFESNQFNYADPARASVVPKTSQAS